VAILVLQAMGLIACLGLGLMLLLLEVQLGRAPRLGPNPDPGPLRASFLRLVIPAYNEESNIVACLDSALASLDPGLVWELVVADDGSTDATVGLVQERFEADQGDAGPACRLLSVGPRPEGERWCGKNWPASQAAALVWPAGDPREHWLLFIDADVRLEAPALKAVLQEVAGGDSAGPPVDLLTLAPRLECGCLAEWLVQPIVASLLGLGFPLKRSNDPADSTAFAAGPFMLFRRSAYEAIGGHRAVAGEVVEDLALAQAIKTSGHRLLYLLGIDLVRLRMYQDLQSLWEGWTKNWYLGVDRNPFKAIGSALVVIGGFSLPWLLLLLAFLNPSLALLGLLGIGLQLAIRLWSRIRFGTPLRYWWLAWLGGLLIGAIVPASIWKTTTGKGWTWRGRSLA
jgi:glycosyltransferase involved in cell wall biosynthesis